MNTVLVDCQSRAAEVEKYFGFVRGLSEGTVSIRNSRDQQPDLNSLEQAEFLKTLKASCYLLLYNLVESTMRNVVQQIFDEFRTRQIRYDVCRMELKRLVLLHFRRRNIDKLIPRLVDIARDIVTETFDKEEMFSGNLDAKMIRHTAERFGFAAPPKGQGAKLVTVKNARNDLAHGIKSFSEVGREASVDDLDQAKVQVVEILATTITNVSDYLTSRAYMDATMMLRPESQTGTTSNQIRVQT